MIIEIRGTGQSAESVARLEIADLTSKHRPPLVDFVRGAHNTLNDTVKAEKTLRGVYAPTGEAPSYSELVRAIWEIFRGNLPGARKRLLACYFKLYPKNHYALSLLLSIGQESATFSKWARYRIHEISTWDGAEDIYVFGDSHGYYCFGGMARSRAFVFANRTLYKFPDMAPFLEPALRSVPKYGHAIFCYGYNDVNIHVKKVAEARNVNSDQVMHELVERYVDSIKDYTRGRPDINVLISAVVPASPYWPLEKGSYYGLPLERAGLTQKLNALLEQETAAAGFAFIDIHNIFSDADGCMKKTITDNDGIHTNLFCYNLVERQVVAAIDAVKVDGNFYDIGNSNRKIEITHEY